MGPVLCVDVIDEHTIISESKDKTIKIWRQPPTLVKGVDQSAGGGGGVRSGGGGGGGSGGGGSGGGGGGSLFATE